MLLDWTLQIPLIVQVIRLFSAVFFYTAFHWSETIKSGTERKPCLLSANPLYLHSFLGLNLCLPLVSQFLIQLYRCTQLSFYPNRMVRLIVLGKALWYIQLSYADIICEWDDPKITATAVTPKAQLAVLLITFSSAILTPTFDRHSIWSHEDAGQLHERPFKGSKYA